jgi:DNA (cytosine-5)-methyltransferase 1
LIGQRALDDPRNQLVKHFLRLVIEIQPQAFVLENVKGLTVGKHKGFLDEIVKESEAAGYNVELPWQVLNAKNYGVPQDRQRLFLIGVKKGLPLPGYPDQIDDELRVTCEDALGDIPDAESFGTLVDADTVKTTRFGDPSSYAAEMRCVSRESWRYGYQRVWDPALLTSSMRTGHTEISRIRFSETEEGTVEPISRFYKLSRKGVSNTLRAGTDSARGAFTSPRPIHYKYNRCITVREMARLHGFPDWFRFHPTKWHGARQIGNAVPPPLARAVGDQILRETLGLEPKMPAEILKLDSEDLLKFDMKGASAYWGIDVPIGKRDRKSGAKKRKQEDIERERLAG